MPLPSILHLLVAVLTVLVGAVSVLLPRTAARFTGFGDQVSPRGRSEVRSVLGGAFIGLGLAPFLMNFDYSAYQVLGYTYLAIAIVRTVSILALDRDTSRSSLISVVSEYVFAAILLLLRPA